MAEEVYAVFNERGIAVQRDAIASALEDPVAGCENAEWLSKHLHPETLLSREELALYFSTRRTKSKLAYANGRDAIGIPSLKTPAPSIPFFAILTSPRHDLY